MNTVECIQNINLCKEFYNLTLCSSIENSYCSENRGICIIHGFNQSKCVCSPCFTGNHCEDEVSRNLWGLGMIQNTIVPNTIPIFSIIRCLFGFFLIINGLLCLQTYLCVKIRRTNLGIYLIMLSIVSIAIGLIHCIQNSIDLYVKNLEIIIYFSAMVCPFEKYIYIPLVSMYNWFIAAVAIERVLVECFRDYGLHDSRQRSVIFSIIILIGCPVSALPGFFTVQEMKNSSYLFKLTYCQNYTEFGYVLFEIITRFHFFSFLFIYILMNIIVLSKLIRRRQRFVDNDSLFKQIRLIMNKHKDFFIPYLTQALGQLPSLILGYMVNCSTAGTMLVANLYLICHILEVLPFTITFYLYICLSPVYLVIFWESSPIGKCLKKIMNKLQCICKNRTNYDSIPLEVLNFAN